MVWPLNKEKRYHLKSVLDVFGSEGNLIESELMSHIVFKLSLVLFTFFKDHDAALFVHFLCGAFGVFGFF